MTRLALIWFTHGVVHHISLIRIRLCTHRVPKTSSCGVVGEGGKGNGYVCGYIGIASVIILEDVLDCIGVSLVSGLGSISIGTNFGRYSRCPTLGPCPILFSCLLKFLLLLDSEPEELAWCPKLDGGVYGERL